MYIILKGQNHLTNLPVFCFNSLIFILIVLIAGPEHHDISKTLARVPVCPHILTKMCATFRCSSTSLLVIIACILDTKISGTEHCLRIQGGGNKGRHVGWMMGGGEIKPKRKSKAEKVSQSSLMKIARERTYDLDINKEEPYARDEEQKYLQAALASPTARAERNKNPHRAPPTPAQRSPLPRNEGRNISSRPHLAEQQAPQSSPSVTHGGRRPPPGPTVAAPAAAGPAPTPPPPIAPSGATGSGSCDGSAWTEPSDGGIAMSDASIDSADIVFRSPQPPRFLHHIRSHWDTASILLPHD